MYNIEPGVLNTLMLRYFDTPSQLSKLQVKESATHMKMWLLAGQAQSQWHTSGTSASISQPPITLGWIL